VADFFTTGYNELLSRSEVNAPIISTEENEHAGPIPVPVLSKHSSES
jgi:hypothetical protein